MARTALVPAVATGLLLLSWAVAAEGQAELKQRPTPTAPPSVAHAPSRSAATYQRVTARIAVGEQAPDFTLDRIDGKPYKLSSERGGWIMMFFVERRESLDVVAPVASALRGIGVSTVAVCWDKTHVLERQFRGRTPDYTPLADPTGDIVSLYGLLGGDSGEATQPGFVLIDPHGLVRLALLGQALPGDDTSRMVQLAVQGED
jgi:peroxiredoxin